jgi:hypothetical protein
MTLLRLKGICATLTSTSDLIVDPLTGIVPFDKATLFISKGIV